MNGLEVEGTLVTGLERNEQGGGLFVLAKDGVEVARLFVIVPILDRRERTPVPLSWFEEAAGRAVDTFVTTEDGTLYLGLRGLAPVEVQPDERLEAWNLVARDGRLLFSLPGGGVDGFSPP